MNIAERRTRERQMNRTINPRDLRSMLESRQDVTILDVRRKVDYDADHGVIPDADWRDPERVEVWSMDLPKNRELVIYCARGGSVSNMILDRLLDKGIQARYIEGGIAEWKAAGGEIIEKTSRENIGDHEQHG
jgi:rhodanese-related sulfurtransferase